MLSPINQYSISQVYLYDNSNTVTSGKLQASEEGVAMSNNTAPIYQDINDINYNEVDRFQKEESNSPANSTGAAEQSKENTEEQSEKPKTNESQNPADKKLNEEEELAVAKLKTIDVKVRQHEQAHLAVAGGLATGGISYSFQAGPDGKRYAVGGSVNIDTTTEKTPQATIQKMQRVIAAAMAPADPSGQDLAVAASARKIIVEMKRQTSELQESQASAEPENANSARNATVIANDLDSNSNISKNTLKKPFTASNLYSDNYKKIDIYKQNDSILSGYLPESKINLRIA